MQVPDWAELRHRLLLFVRSRVAADAADAEDVVQEVLLRMARDIESLRDGDRLDAWAYRIARNAIIDEHRRRGRYSTVVDRVADQTRPGTEDSTAQAVADADLVELSDCLLPMVDRLDEPYRSALRLTSVDGLTQAEAAARAGVSLSGMKSRVQRGRHRLREVLLACCSLEETDPDRRGRPLAAEGCTGCGCGCR